MKRKIMAFALSVFIAASAAACENRPAEPAPTPTPVPTQTQTPAPLPVETPEPVVDPMTAETLTGMVYAQLEALKQSDHNIHIFNNVATEINRIKTIGIRADKKLVYINYSSMENIRIYEDMGAGMLYYFDPAEDAWLQCRMDTDKFNTSAAADVETLLTFGEDTTEEIIYSGRRMVDGKEYYVLSALTPEYDPDTELPDPSEITELPGKEFEELVETPVPPEETVPPKEFEEYKNFEEEGSAPAKPIVTMTPEPTDALPTPTPAVPVVEIEPEKEPDTVPTVDDRPFVLTKYFVSVADETLEMMVIENEKTTTVVTFDNHTVELPEAAIKARKCNIQNYENFLLMQGEKANES